MAKIREIPKILYAGLKGTNPLSFLYFRPEGNILGKPIEKNKFEFKELSEYVLNKKTLDPNEPGRQEYLESVINQYLAG